MFQTQIIELITAGCKILPAVEYTNGYNNISKIICITLLYPKKWNPIPTYTATDDIKRGL